MFLTKSGERISLPYHDEGSNVYVHDFGRIVLHNRHYYRVRNGKIVHPYPVGFRSSVSFLNDNKLELIIDYTNISPMFKATEFDKNRKIVRMFQNESLPILFSYIKSGRVIPPEVSTDAFQFFGFNSDKMIYLLKGITDEFKPPSQDFRTPFKQKESYQGLLEHVTEYELIEHSQKCKSRFMEELSILEDDLEDLQEISRKRKRKSTSGGSESTPELLEKKKKKRKIVSNPLSPDIKFEDSSSQQQEMRSFKDIGGGKFEAMTPENNAVDPKSPELTTPMVQKQELSLSRKTETPSPNETKSVSISGFSSQVPKFTSQDMPSQKISNVGTLAPLYVHGKVENGAREKIIQVEFSKTEALFLVLKNEKLETYYLDQTEWVKGRSFEGSGFRVFRFTPDCQKVGIVGLHEGLGDSKQLEVQSQDIFQDDATTVQLYNIKEEEEEEEELLELTLGGNSDVDVLNVHFFREEDKANRFSALLLARDGTGSFEAFDSACSKSLSKKDVKISVSTDRIVDSVSCAEQGFKIVVIHTFKHILLFNRVSLTTVRKYKVPGCGGPTSSSDGISFIKTLVPITGVEKGLFAAAKFKSLDENVGKYKLVMVGMTSLEAKIVHQFDICINAGSRGRESKEGGGDPQKIKGFNTSEEYVVCGMAKGEVMMFGADSGKCVAILRDQKDSVTAVAIHKKFPLMATCSRDAVYVYFQVQI